MGYVLIICLSMYAGECVKRISADYLSEAACETERAHWIKHRKDFVYIRCVPKQAEKA